MQVLELPQSSVAVQVLTTADSFVQPPGETASAKVTVTEASQLSVAVAMPTAGLTAGSMLAEHWIVTLGGQVMTGGKLSSIVIN